jgi:hypothetical protein
VPGDKSAGHIANHLSAASVFLSISGCPHGRGHNTCAITYTLPTRLTKQSGRLSTDYNEGSLTNGRVLGEVPQSRSRLHFHTLSFKHRGSYRSVLCYSCRQKTRFNPVEHLVNVRSRPKVETVWDVFLHQYGLCSSTRMVLCTCASFEENVRRALRATEIVCRVQAPNDSLRHQSRHALTCTNPLSGCLHSRIISAKAYWAVKSLKFVHVFLQKCCVGCQYICMCCFSGK